jgi:thiol-disulfide isomerase/thioredoxin
MLRLIFLLAAVLLGGCDDPVSPLKVQVGQTILPLALEDLHNRPVTLRPSPGKLLMINVWATWCAPCRHEMPSLQRLVAQLDVDRFKLVGVSVDADEHVVREYLIEHDIDFPSLLDRHFAVVNGIFGVRVFPSTFFVGPEGTLLRVIEGWRDWNTPEMVAEIRALLPASAQKPQGSEG